MFYTSTEDINQFLTLKLIHTYIMTQKLIPITTYFLWFFAGNRVQNEYGSCI